LKGLVREALDRAVSLLGPGARDKARKAEAHVDVTLLAPGPVGEVHGRSLLLPLVVALTRAVAERLNLGATARWEAGIVWTGDVDDHGALHSVTGLAEKLTRVMASRCAGMAFPAADDERLRAALSGISRARPLALRPIAGLLDLTAGGGPGEIKPRSLAVRGVSVVKRASRPLGIAGTIAVTILLLALAYAAPRLSSWLDRMPTAAFVTADSSHIELRNSLNRKLRLLPIARTSLSWTVVNDIDDDGRPEFFYGTGCADSARGSIFCFDGHGKTLWRFAGGPAADETLPYPLRNRFGADGVFAHNPHYAGQLALLRRDGSYVSSFWHPGHLSIQLHPKHKESPLFTDIDGDGYSEILFGATNNRLNQAVLVILDPRRIRGKGFEGPTNPPDPQWQSYVVFPRLAELEEAMGSPRFHVGSLRIDELDGSPMICFGLWGMLPAVGRTNVFNYWLDFDLQVVRFYSGDPFKTWGAWALRKGLLDIDVCSKEFEDYMRQIEVIPGPAELLRP
ncbi:hypothetical protein JXA88_10900, partial [Candidatus Fermentibacteria bacterium]|nr:hypothetical protein [Candidatus Fermentibacteria bacterium]